MAEVDGRPNLFRTVDMLRQTGVPADRIICASRQRHSDFVGNYCRFLALPETGSTCETILQASSGIIGERVFLLGDVIYTRSAVSRIVTDKAQVRFFGRPGASRFSSKIWGEIFALRLSETGWQSARPLIEELVGRLSRGEIDRAILWDIYFGLVGDSGRPLKISKSLFSIIDDQTDDYDTREEYDRLLRRHNALQTANPFARMKYLWLPNLRYLLRNARHSFKQHIGLQPRPFIITD